MKKILNKFILNLALLGAVLGFSLGVKPVLAQYYSVSSINKSISVDKKVRNIHDDRYFDNIDKNFELFSDNDLIEFKITVLNTGNTDLTNINVGDSLPGGLKLIFYPGTIDKTNNSINWSIDSLKVGESSVSLIRANIVDVEKILKTGENNKLMTNTVEVTSGQIGDSDNASYYIGIKSMPKTGSEEVALGTIIALSVLISATELRKVARGY